MLRRLQCTVLVVTIKQRQLEARVDCGDAQVVIGEDVSLL